VGGELLPSILDVRVAGPLGPLLQVCDITPEIVSLYLLWICGVTQEVAKVADGVSYGLYCAV